MEWEEEENEEMPKTKKKLNPAGNMIGCCSFFGILFDCFINVVHGVVIIYIYMQIENVNISNKDSFF